MAKNYFLTPLQQKTQTLLGKFGQAQFNLAVDDRGRFNKSSVSLFTPWYDNPHQLLFSQMGIHDQQGRMITHLGIGQRIDMPDNRWRWGYNFFFDYDWSRSHRRMGMGLETSMDYLKFAANYYHPLSNWRDSADVEDYLERPARGFDIRGQGYLPAYPQLGASLKYEQYFGDEVGLFGFGKNQRQKDPRAVNLGLNYTPFPLATINVNHKQGQQRQKETQFGLTLNYQWGVTLQQQLDPTKVGTSRSLTGNRFDLVDRNYDIVLEYKEKQVISVDLPPVTPGLIEGDSYIMQPLVKTKYPITKIRWLGDVVPLSLVATAGSLNPQGWKITLPTWRPESEDSNTYQLAIELTDKKGNTAISNNLHILNGHNRKGKLSVIGDNKAPASGIVADAIQVKINVQDHKGNTVQLKGIKPTWYVVDKDGKRVPVVTEKRCPKNSNGMRLPCIRVIEPNQPEANEYVVKVVSSLHGSFELAASLADYGESNRLSLLFAATNSTEDVRIVILDPKGSNLLKTGDTPLVGKAYEAKFYAKNDEDITEQIPPDHIRWLLHGENSECGASGASLNNHDTGVRGYTFTPRESHESNTGLTCGDQGFKIRVTY